MDENPYQAPVDRAQLAAPHAPNRAIRAFAAGMALGAALVVALIVAGLVALSRVDIRENGRYWDEIARREKAGMTHEEAVESYQKERDAWMMP